MAGRFIRLVTLACAVVVCGCGGGKSVQSDRVVSTAPEPDYVTVQHILIGFEGSLPGKDVMRSKEEARALAMELFGRAQAGEDFDTLVEEYTDDRFPGVYGIANKNSEPDKARQIYAREDMADAFGDVSFALAVGEIGLAEYDEKHCPYGWHIIIRIK